MRAPPPIVGHAPRPLTSSRLIFIYANFAAPVLIVLKIENNNNKFEAGRDNELAAREMKESSSYYYYEAARDAGA